jgi:polysaccharide pyruvyl transferase WcaK-like protein
MVMKISMVGWYGRRNIGDEAFKLAHEALLSPHEITYHVDKIDKDADCVILGAGDVIQPFYLDVIPREREFYVLGAGLGYRPEAALLKERRVRQAIVRNAADVELLRAQEVNAAYAPDLTFILDHAAMPRVELESAGDGRKKLCVLLSDHISPSHWHADPRRLSYFEYFKWELAQAISFLSEFYEIYWLPLSDDLDAFDTKLHMDVLHRVARRGAHHLLPYPGTPEVAIGTLREMDLVVSMKYHGIIFATLLGVPFVNIGVSRKTQQFCIESKLAEYSVLPFSFEKERFLEYVKNAEKGGTASLLRSIASRNRQELKKLRDRVLGTWSDA